MKKFFNWGKKKDGGSDTASSKQGSTGTASRHGSVSGGAGALGSRQSGSAGLGASSGSLVVASGPGVYEIRDRDLGKIHKAVVRSDRAKVRQYAKKDANVPDKQRRTPLHLACALGYVAIVEELLEWKPQVNVMDDGRKTPLLKALECKQPQCAKLMLDARADPKAKDTDGNCCYHYIAKENFVDLVPTVRKYSRDDPALLNLKNVRGESPLHLAVMYGHLEVCEELLTVGANVNITGPRDLTPLMIACQSGDEQLVEILLRFKPDAALKETKGSTAADLADSGGHVSCKQLLNRYEGHADKASDAAAGGGAEVVYSTINHNRAKPTNSRPNDEGDESVRDDEDDDEDRSRLTQSQVATEPWSDSESESEVSDRKAKLDKGQATTSRDVGFLRPISSNNIDDIAEDDEELSSLSTDRHDANYKSSPTARNKNVQYQKPIILLNNKLKADLDEDGDDIHPKENNLLSKGQGSRPEINGGRNSPDQDQVMPLSARSITTTASDSWSDDDDNDAAIKKQVQTGVVKSNGVATGANVASVAAIAGGAKKMKEEEESYGTGWDSDADSDVKHKTTSQPASAPLPTTNVKSGPANSQVSRGWSNVVLTTPEDAASPRQPINSARSTSSGWDTTTANDDDDEDEIDKIPTVPSKVPTVVPQAKPAVAAVAGVGNQNLRKENPPHGKVQRTMSEDSGSAWDDEDDDDDSEKPNIPTIRYVEPVVIGLESVGEECELENIEISDTNEKRNISPQVGWPIRLIQSEPSTDESGGSEESENRPSHKSAFRKPEKIIIDSIKSEIDRKNSDMNFCKNGDGQASTDVNVAIKISPPDNNDAERTKASNTEASLLLLRKVPNSVANDVEVSSDKVGTRETVVENIPNENVITNIDDFYDDIEDAEDLYKATNSAQQIHDNLLSPWNSTQGQNQSNFVHTLELSSETVSPANSAGTSFDGSEDMCSDMPQRDDKLSADDNAPRDTSARIFPEKFDEVIADIKFQIKAPVEIIVSEPSEDFMPIEREEKEHVRKKTDVNLLNVYQHSAMYDVDDDEDDDDDDEVELSDIRTKPLSSVAHAPRCETPVTQFLHGEISIDDQNSAVGNQESYAEEEEKERKSINEGAKEVGSSSSGLRSENLLGEDTSSFNENDDAARDVENDDELTLFSEKAKTVETSTKIPIPIRRSTLTAGSSNSAQKSDAEKLKISSTDDFQISQPEKLVNNLPKRNTEEAIDPDSDETNFGVPARGSGALNYDAFGTRILIDHQKVTNVDETHEFSSAFTTVVASESRKSKIPVSRRNADDSWKTKDPQQGNGDQEWSVEKMLGNDANRENIVSSESKTISSVHREEIIREVTTQVHTAVSLRDMQESTEEESTWERENKAAKAGTNDSHLSNIELEKSRQQVAINAERTDEMSTSFVHSPDQPKLTNKRDINDISINKTSEKPPQPTKALISSNVVTPVKRANVVDGASMRAIDDSFSDTDHDDGLSQMGSTRSRQGVMSLSTGLPNVLDLQEQVRQRQLKLDEERNVRQTVENKVKVLEEEKIKLTQKVDELKKEVEAAAKAKIELDAKLQNSDYKLSDESARRVSSEDLLERVKGQLSAKEDECKQSMEELQTLELSLKAEQKVIKQLQEEKKQLEKNLKEVTEKETVKKQEVGLLGAINRSNTDAESPELYAAKLELDRQKELNIDTSRRLEFTIKTLEQDKTELEHQLCVAKDTLTSSTTEHTLKLAAVQQQVETLKGDLEREKQTKSKLDAEIKSLRNQLDQVNNELTRTKEAKEELDRNLARQTDSCKRLQEQNEKELQKSLNSGQSRSQQVNDLLERCNKLESELMVATTSLTERERRLLSSQRELEQKQANISTLTNSIQTYKEENIRLSIEEKSLQDRLATSQQEVLLMRKQFEAERSIDKQPEKLTQLLDSIKADNDRIKENLRDQNASLTETVARLKEELRVAERRRADADDEKCCLQASLNEANRQLSVSDSAAQEAVQMRHQLEVQRAELKTQIDRLKTRLDEVKRELVTSEQTADELRAQVRSLEKSLAGTVDERMKEFNRVHQQTAAKLEQLEREKQDITSHMHEEKQRRRKAVECYKTAEAKLEEEQERCNHLAKQCQALKLNLKAAKKRIKALKIQMALDDVGHELDAAKQQLRLEASVGRPQQQQQLRHEPEQLRGGVENGYQYGDRDTPEIERMTNTSGRYWSERSDLDRVRADLEERARKELNNKMREVKNYLDDQAKARSKLNQIRDENEAAVRMDFERVRRELTDEVNKLKMSRMIGQRGTESHDQQQQIRELFESEARLREILTARIDRAQEKVTKAQIFSEHLRSLTPSGLKSDWLYDNALPSRSGDECVRGSERNRSFLSKSRSSHGLNDISTQNFLDELDKSIARHSNIGPNDVLASDERFVSDGPTTDFMATMQRNFLL